MGEQPARSHATCCHLAPHATLDTDGEFQVNFALSSGSTHRFSSFCRLIKVSFLPSPRPFLPIAWSCKNVGRIWKQTILTGFTNPPLSTWAWTSCPDSKSFQFLILSHHIIGNDNSNFFRIICGCKGYTDPRLGNWLSHELKAERRFDLRVDESLLCTQASLTFLSHWKMTLSLQNAEQTGLRVLKLVTKEKSSRQQSHLSDVMSPCPNDLLLHWTTGPWSYKCVYKGLCNQDGSRLGPYWVTLACSVPMKRAQGP